jgi:hypothetical protein
MTAKRARPLDGYAKPARTGEIPLVEGQQPIRLTIYCCLEHHLVARVPQHRTPQERDFDRFADSAQGIQQRRDLFDGCASSGQLLRTRKHRLVLQSQRNREQWRRLLSQGGTYPGPGGSAAAAHRSDQHVSVQSQLHIARHINTASPALNGRVRFVALPSATVLRTVRMMRHDLTA